jgi:hypothetical protein
VEGAHKFNARAKEQPTDPSHLELPNPVSHQTEQTAPESP